MSLACNLAAVSGALTAVTGAMTVASSFLLLPVPVDLIVGGCGEFGCGDS